jgi:arsenate reductase
MNAPKRVLILCTGNSARSQMAEGILREIGGDDFEVASAGISPSHVRPEAIKVMSELGLDISDHRSKSLDEFMGQQFDYVITVCDNANEHCPVFPGQTERIHWSFEDPAAADCDEPARLDVFRRVRDEIKARLENFAQSLPIACSLTALELRDRRTTVLQKVRSAVIEINELSDGYCYTFPSAGEMLGEVSAMIELERQCCPFLQFRVTVAPNGGPLSLEMTGPAGTKEFLLNTFNANEE